MTLKDISFIVNGTIKYIKSKYPNEKNTMDRWLVLIGEEYGELCRAINDGDINNVIEEGTQTIAAIYLMLQQFTESNEVGVPKKVEPFLNDAQNNIPKPILNKANAIARKYNGWKRPQEISALWKELNSLGIDVGLISGMPNREVAGTKMWSVGVNYNNTLANNTKLIYSVYEGNSDTDKNEYLIYFS